VGSALLCEILFFMDFGQFSSLVHLLHYISGAKKWQDTAPHLLVHRYQVDAIDQTISAVFIGTLAFHQP
jgi:hypothetical protein